MEYSIKDLQGIINKGFESLILQQPLLTTKNLNINERTVSTALANILTGYFEGFHVNAEYNRMTDENGEQITKRLELDEPIENPEVVYPDIIVHNQIDGEHNLLVIEIKMAWKNKGKEFDIKKLAAFTTQLNYSYGLYLEIGEKKITDMIWVVAGELI